MQAAYASQTINPSGPCRMEGYGPRWSTGQYDDLEVCSLLLESGQPLLLHVLDVVLIERELSDRLKLAASRACGLSPDQVIIAATHTHSGPTVSHVLEREVAPDPQYLQQLEGAVVENSRRCLAQRRPARAFWGRCELKGLFSNRNDPNIPCQTEGYLLRLEDAAGNAIADLLQCACHPTVLGGDNTMVSADYMGAMRRRYTQRTGIPCLSVNGAGGDVSTRLTRRGQNFDEVVRTGNAMADAFACAALGPALELEELDIRPVSQPVSFFPSERDMLLLPKETITFTQTAYVYHWGPLILAAVPGEMVAALGERLRVSTDRALILVCYANEFHGYAVNMEQYGQYFESYNTMYPPETADVFVGDILARF